jgi:hypothetical protein
METANAGADREDGMGLSIRAVNIKEILSGKDSKEKR